MIDKIQELIKNIDVVLSARDSLGQHGSDHDVLYDLVFECWRENIDPLLQELGVDFEWYDPDTTPEADVRAFADALEQRVRPTMRNLLGRYQARAAQRGTLGGE